ncbi:hypothetical protein ACCS79_03570 [Rhizobium johnstonii]|uniref:hypothetical protein n=1 Tax=Rhizobium johnstonii TaxID=3019933 RepID=UPI003F9C104F
MAKYPATPLSPGYHRIQGVMAFYQSTTSPKLFKIGPVGSVVITLTPTEVEARSSEKGSNDLIATYVTQRDGTVALNDIQMWTPWLYAALYMAEHKYLTQTAKAAQTLEIPDPATGDVVQVPGVKATITSVTDGAPSDPVEYEVDDDFGYHTDSGLLEILNVPAAADEAKAVVTYSLPAITEAEGILDLAAMSVSGTRGKLILIGVIESNPGVPVTVVVPDVEFRPNGDIPMGDVSALNVVSLTGRIYNTDPKGMAFITSQKALI